MADVAKAYVQIIPSAEGIKGSLTDMLSGEASSAGTKAGGAFSGGMSKAIGAAKIGATAIAATGAIAASASTALVAGAAGVAEYGDNIDKMSQKMGISAEAYQEWDAIMQHSGTSIDALKPSMKTLAQQAQKGAEEFQLLGISEDEVAKLSQEDLFSKVIAGLQGMEEGTERTAITSKLLGRCATELGALLNTSAEDTEKMRQKVHELGGVMSDDAVKAAATFQDTLQDMGTGFDSLKRNMLSEFLPSITTVMDGMTDIFTGNNAMGLDKLSEGISAFVDTAITDVLPKLLDLGMSIVESLAQGIIQNLDKLVDMAVTIISSLGQFIIENLPMLIQSGLDILLELGDSITQNLPTLIPAIVDVVVEIVNTIADNADKLIEGAVTLITTLALALTEPQTLVKLIEAAIKLILALAEGLLKAIPQLLQAVPVIITNLFTALVQGVPKIAEAAVELVKAIFQTFTSIDWLGLGKDIITGIINGIISMAGALVDTMKNLAKSALEGAKNLLGIHSPSKVFRDDVGQMIGLGMVEGIEESINPVQNAMNALSAASIGKMNASNQIKNSGYGQVQLAGAGFGDITIPVYIGSTKMGQAVASANNLNNYRSGGR